MAKVRSLSICVNGVSVETGALWAMAGGAPETLSGFAVMGTTSGPLTWRPRSSRKLVGQHGWLANLGGHGKQISRIRHERRGDRAV
jgi:hypothetical protein